MLFWLQILTSEFNIGFQQPSNDRCRHCVEWEVAEKAGELTDEHKDSWGAHKEEISEMKKQLKTDIALDQEVPDIICACFDLKKVRFSVFFCS